MNHEAQGSLFLFGLVVPDNLVAVFTLGDGDACNQAIVLGDTGFGFISANEDGSTFVDSVGNLPTSNEWYHITMTRTAEEIRFYLDGVLIKTIPTGGNLPCTGDFPEANLATLLGQHFEGRADDIRVYKRALTDDEVLGLTYGYDPSTAGFSLMSDFYYQANGRLRFSGFQPTEIVYEANGRLLLYDQRLFLWWRLDEGTGALAYDSGPYNHQGALTNMETGTDWVSGNPAFSFPNVSALIFDGSDEYVFTDLTDLGELDGGFSLSVWINVPNVPAS